MFAPPPPVVLNAQAVSGILGYVSFIYMFDFSLFFIYLFFFLPLALELFY